jgi:glutathione S-transferase
MKLYDGGRAPNPRRVRIFLAEKGMSVPVEKIDLAQLQHKSAEFTALNPLQRVPVLVLDDGTVITESIAICRYFEGLRPQPARCSAAGRWRRRWSRCGTGASSSISTRRSRRCFATCTPR